MSDADRRDPSGLRIGGWVPESEAEPPAPRDAVTELLPAIRDTRPPARPAHQSTQELVVVGGLWSDDQAGGRQHRPFGRVLVGVLAALLGIAAVIVVPLTIGSAPPPRDASAWEFEPGPAPIIVETTAVAATSAAATSRPSPTPSPTPASLVGPKTTTSPTPAPTTPSPTPFAPLTLQAEDGTRTGSAVVDRPSCATSLQVVRLIGDWTNNSPDNDGTLTFRNLALAPGVYTMTVHYVITSDNNRDAQIRFVGANPSTIRVNFPAAACMTSKAVPINLPAGTTAIEFSNSTGRAPTIDKIVLSR